jgi:hypothetical protein
MRRWMKGMAVAAVVVGLLAAGGLAFYRYQFPYGPSHCCDLALHGALTEYAAEHDGAFPTGRPTPEAALSLLFPKQAGAYLLGGKAVAESTAQALLERGEPLGPDSCSWHYVEGLRVDDDPRLALFWDKTGLAHNGRRMSGGGHIVLFVSGERRHVSAEEWPGFLEEQRDLLSRRGRGDELRIDAEAPIHGVRVQAQLRVVDNGLYATLWRDGRFSLRELIAHIDREPEVGIVGLPVVTAGELRRAATVLDESNIRFVFFGREVVCDGSAFRFE